MLTVNHNVTAVHEPIAARAAGPFAVSGPGVVKECGQGEARVKALDHVDLDVSAGELTLLVGPSGCGKTTLLSVIAGLLEPTRGEVTVLETNLTRLSGREKV